MAFRTARYRAVPRHPSKHGANMVGPIGPREAVRSVVVAAGVVDAWQIRCGIRDGAEAHGRLQVGQRLCGMERSTSGGPAMYLVWTCPLAARSWTHKVLMHSPGSGSGSGRGGLGAWD